MMAGDPFARAVARLFVRLGVEAVLRGDVSTRVVVHDGVQIIGTEGEYLGRRKLVGLLASDSPRRGDTLAIGDALYVLDAEQTDDGYEQRFVVRAAT